MTAYDWQAWCRAADDLKLDGGGATVTFAEGRRHFVTVKETADTYDLMSVVARAGVVGSLTDPELLAWRRNRSSQLVGFKLDIKGRLVAEAWVPKAGTTKGEFLNAMRHVAAEADLFEYQLTGEDRE